MAAGRFDDALQFVLRWEGGYSNHPNDRGGETNFGITHRVYDDWRRSMGQPLRSVRFITPQEVSAIYRTRYWDASRADDLPGRIDLAVFDAAVNMGIGTSAKMLQRAVGAKADGSIGPKTIAAVRATNVNVTLATILAAREARYRLYASKPGQSVFLKGWLNRLNDLRRVLEVPS